jgi:hypothetical protein
MVSASLLVIASTTTDNFLNRSFITAMRSDMAALRKGRSESSPPFFWSSAEHVSKATAKPFAPAVTCQTQFKTYHKDVPELLVRRSGLEMRPPEEVKKENEFARTDIPPWIPVTAARLARLSHFSLNSSNGACHQRASTTQLYILAYKV